MKFQFFYVGRKKDFSMDEVVALKPQDKPKQAKKPKKVPHPHDHLIKKLLSNVATTKDICTLHLPVEITNLINLDTLKPQPDSFIDDEHRAFATDILYKARFKNKMEECYIWI